MNQSLVLIILIFFFQFLSAQDITFIDHTFSDENIEIPHAYGELDEIILLQDRRVEIVSTTNSVEQYIMVHEKTLVNSDDAIEKNNRQYIGFEENENIIRNESRIILPSGKIIELNVEDIHEDIDTETGRSYKYYALKGLEKGAIIERLFIKQEVPKLSDAKFIFQYDVPVIQSEFRLIHPNFLGFKTKNYNGLSDPVFDEEKYENKTEILIQEENINPLNEEEQYSNPAVHKKAFRYLFYENKNTGQKNFYNYNQFANNAHANVNIEMSKKDVKSLGKYIKGLSKTDNMYDNIISLEHLIKTTIAIDYYYDKNQSIADIINSKKGNTLDLLRLYKALFKNWEIPAEMVFTTDRFENTFDLEFETTNNLSHSLFYFPEIDMFLDIKNSSLRTPLIDFGLGNNNGIRLKEREFAGEIMCVAKPIFIEIPDMYLSTDTMLINIDFTKDISNPTINSYLEYGGYSGANLQAIVDLVPADQYDNIVDDILKNYSADTEMKNVNLINNGLKNMGRENFIIELEFDGESLIQKAGDKYLFKLGETIGKQSEIYQADQRTLPIEIMYPHDYYRKLTILLPEGYKISNPEMVNFNFKTIINDEEEAIFTSQYEQKNNVFAIENKEYYKQVTYPIESFPDYQSVINAAADFNKIVLVLEKE